MAENQERNQTSQEGIYQKETICPSCGRFIGTYERCPYCQAWVPKRLSVRIFKILALLLSTIGLLLLLFFARTIQTPEIKICEIGPLMNFAHVRLTGVVERSFGVHPQWHSLAFTLVQPDVGSEPLSIRVSAYAKVAAEIEKRGNVPEEGDEVSVEGTVRYQKDTPSLLINAPEHLLILKRANHAKNAAPLTASDITRDMLGKTVTVHGVIADSVTFPRGALLRLADRKEGLAIWIPARAWEDIQTPLHIGDAISITGKVKTFRDELEIEVTSSKGIELIEKALKVTSGPSHMKNPFEENNKSDVAAASEPTNFTNSGTTVVQPAVTASGSGLLIQEENEE